MPVKLPTLDDLADIAAGYSLSLEPEDLASFQGIMEDTIASYNRLDELTEPSLPVVYPRSPGFRPQPEDNPLNAWYWRSEIKGAASGPLAGKTVAIKDNVCVAGVPMMNGSSILEGYVPEIDATIVTRILEGRGTILGNQCARISVSLGPATLCDPAVRNPHDLSRTTGGSSERQWCPGASGAVDLALWRSGGSIRIRVAGVAYSSDVGLVPYTGLSIETYCTLGKWHARWQTWPTWKSWLDRDGLARQQLLTVKRIARRCRQCEWPAFVL